jgi:hypothetical protein
MWHENEDSNCLVLKKNCVKMSHVQPYKAKRSVEIIQEDENE